MCGMLLGYPELDQPLFVFLQVLGKSQMLLSQVSVGPIHLHGHFLQSLKKDGVTTYPCMPLPPHEAQRGLPPVPASAELIVNTL